MELQGKDYVDQADQEEPRREEPSEHSSGPESTHAHKLADGVGSGLAARDEPTRGGEQGRTPGGLGEGQKAQEGGGRHGVRCAEVPGRVRQVPSKEGFLTFIHGARLFL